MYFDSHCHLDFTDFDVDRTLVLQHCESLGVRKILLPGVTVEGWDRQLSLLSEGDAFNISLLAALGLHPMFMARHQSEHLDLLRQYLEGRSESVVAVGEIGLDYMLPEDTWEAQQAIFSAQLRIARDFDLPVLLHVRRAHDQVLKLLRQSGFDRGGVVHAFSGSEQQARRYIAKGFYLGVGGAITWPRATRLRTLVSRLPLESLVLETDAPDMVPAFASGGRNSPEYLPEIARQLAELRQQSIENIAGQSVRNMHRLLYAEE